MSRCNQVFPRQLFVENAVCEAQILKDNLELPAIAEEPGDENEYRYPPFDENLVRQRRIAGGYNLNVHEDELGDGAAATGDNRDVGA